eukprot:11390046-Karenia_brevis.AAC.1
MWTNPKKFRVIKADKVNVQVVASGGYKVFAIGFITCDGEFGLQESLKYKEPHRPATSWNTYHDCIFRKLSDSMWSLRGSAAISHMDRPPTSGVWAFFGDDNDPGAGHDSQRMASSFPTPTRPIHLTNNESHHGVAVKGS